MVTRPVIINERTTHWLQTHVIYQVIHTHLAIRPVLDLVFGIIESIDQMYIYVFLLIVLLSLLTE